MKEVSEERLNDLVGEINDSGVFNIDLDWAFDHNEDNNSVSDVYGLITGRWAGQQHKFELGSESNELLEAILDVLNAMSKLKGLK